jgi:hypothetical protein
MPEMPPGNTDSEPPADRDGSELRAIAERLERERPIPRPAFRSELRRRLFFTPAQSPGRIRLLIGAYATSGVVLLLVAVVGVAGAGPLAAG